MSSNKTPALLSTDEVSTADALEHIVRETRRFVDVAARSPRAAHVPAYPAFTTETLAAHIGTGFRLFEGIVSTGQYDAAAAIDVPAGPAVVDWISAGLDPLIATLSDAMPDALVSFPHDDGKLPARSIAPILAVEVGVHRWDLESVLGEHEAIPVQLAVLQIDTLFARFVPRLAASGVGPIGGTVQLRATDAPVSWAVSVEGDALVAGRSTGAEPGADVVVSGPAQDLSLLLWKRALPPLLGIEVAGSGDVLNRLLSVNYVPDPRTTAAH